jgi:hypothetical protein
MFLGSPQRPKDPSAGGRFISAAWPELFRVNALSAEGVKPGRCPIDRRPGADKSVSVRPS